MKGVHTAFQGSVKVLFVKPISVSSSLRRAMARKANALAFPNTVPCVRSSLAFATVPRASYPKTLSAPLNPSLLSKVPTVDVGYQSIHRLLHQTPLANLCLTNANNSIVRCPPHKKIILNTRTVPSPDDKTPLGLSKRNYKGSAGNTGRGAPLLRVQYIRFTIRSSHSTYLVFWLMAYFLTKNKKALNFQIQATTLLTLPTIMTNPSLPPSQKPQLSHTLFKAISKFYLNKAPSFIYPKSSLSFPSIKNLPPPSRQENKSPHTPPLTPRK